MNNEHLHPEGRPYTKEEFINKIKTDNEFAKKWGELGPVYGKQWRKWKTRDTKSLGGTFWGPTTEITENSIDQIANSINLLKTDPDSRRNKVSAWNVGELKEMVIPPCHTDFQFYTRELSLEERRKLWDEKVEPNESAIEYLEGLSIADMHDIFDQDNVKSRAISLMWNQRSVDTFLGLPFNIASYGLLLEIVAKIVNMVPDELIGNLGDTHLYVNHIEQAKEQISRELSLEERRSLVSQEMFNQIYTGGSPDTLSHSECDQWDIPRIIQREPYPLPTLRINTEFWPTESGECGIGNLTDDIDFLIKEMQINDFQIENYKSHPAIKAPLSN
jgi:thymidylate synthase